MTDDRCDIDGVPQDPDDRFILDELRRRMDDFIDQTALMITDEEIEERLRRITGTDDGERTGETTATLQDGCGPADNNQGVASRQRGAGVPLIQSQKVSGLADGVVDNLGSLLAPGTELRTMDADHRQELRAVVAGWRERLRVCPAGAFGIQGSVAVLGTVTTLAEALIADRDEWAALNLVSAAWPHLRFLDADHPVVFEVRRVDAQARTELGWYQEAGELLGRLSRDEQRVIGAADGRTELLLSWALALQGRVGEAGEGFDALTSRLGDLSGAGTLLEHTDCRGSWRLLLLGRVDASVSSYQGVIDRRKRTLGERHPDTLDAWYSQGKGPVWAGQGERAYALLDPLLEVRAQFQGDRHTDTLETLRHWHIARVQIEPRDDRVLAEALRVLAGISRVYRKRYGWRHPLSRDTAAWIRRLRGVREANRFRDPVPDLRQIITTDQEQDTDPRRDRAAAAT